LRWRRQIPNSFFKVLPFNRRAPGGAGASLAPDRAVHPSMIATAPVQRADARSIFTGKQDTVKPVDGNSSRLCSFSMWQSPM
jgi:hypothetical protein